MIQVKRSKVIVKSDNFPENISGKFRLVAADSYGVRPPIDDGKFTAGILYAISLKERKSENEIAKFEAELKLSFSGNVPEEEAVQIIYSTYLLGVEELNRILKKRNKVFLPDYEFPESDEVTVKDRIRLAIHANRKN